jgi:transcriptional regulator of acetoin/glycerol metabolism
MDDDAVDRLAFAHMAVVKWAVEGGKIEALPKVHEELVWALKLILTARSPNRVVQREGANFLKVVEAATVTDAIQRNHGNISSAADELGISRSSVYRRLKQKEHS